MVNSSNISKISVITIVYNDKDVIEETVKSVVDQVYPFIEFIVIDGGSTDGTLEILNKYKNKITCLVSEPDHGIYDAMNKGLSKATGEWVNFLNGGDTYVDKYTLENIFAKNDTEHYHLIYGDRFNLNGDFNNPNKKLIKANFISRESLKKTFGVCHQAIFSRRTITPYYDTNFKYKAEYEWLINIVYAIEPNTILKISQPIIDYLGNGFSQQGAIDNLKERIKLTEAKFGKSQNLFNTLRYMRVLARHYKNLIFAKIKS